jgi:hypothetical protein
MVTMLHTKLLSNDPRSTHTKANWKFGTMNPTSISMAQMDMTTEKTENAQT